MINETRTHVIPARFEKVIVSIDPAVTANAGSDMTGVVTAGITRDGHVYILEDTAETAVCLK